MNIIVTCRDFEGNCTGDYNFLEGIKFLVKEKNLPFSFYTRKKFNPNYEFLKKKYNMEINSIITVHINDGKYNGFPDHVKQIKYLTDIHGWTKVFFDSQNLTYLLPYGYSYDKFNYPNNKVIFFPHNVRHSIPFNNTPVNKILLSGRGRKNSERYPMRYSFYHKSLKDNRVDYFRPDHGYRPSEEKRKTGIFGKKFINKLNNYLCCFCDDSAENTPYLLCKVFEIMSSGSLLLGCLRFTKKYLENLGFIENVHYINMTKLRDGEYDKKVSFILDPKNREKIDEIRKNGYEYCNKFHSSKIRAEQLYNYLIKGDITTTEFNDGLDGDKNKGKYLIFNNI